MFMTPQNKVTQHPRTLAPPAEKTLPHKAFRHEISVHQLCLPAMATLA